jgi:SepF-like predicted cell division protein (DUF552 family)
MSLLDNVFGDSSDKKEQKQNTRRGTREYDSVSRLDEPSSTSNDDTNAEILVQCINVNQNTDIIQTKDELRNGNIVIADISQLSSGLSEERVLKDLRQAVEDMNGDIAMQNTDEHVILTPAGVGVSRRVL